MTGVRRPLLCSAVCGEMLVGLTLVAVWFGALVLMRVRLVLSLCSVALEWVWVVWVLAIRAGLWVDIV